MMGFSIKIFFYCFLTECRLGPIGRCCWLLFLKPWIKLSTSRRVCSMAPKRTKTNIYWVWEHGRVISLLRVDQLVIYFFSYFLLVLGSCNLFLNCYVRDKYLSFCIKKHFLLYPQLFRDFLNGRLVLTVVSFAC